MEQSGAHLGRSHHRGTLRDMARCDLGSGRSRSVVRCPKSVRGVPSEASLQCLEWRALSARHRHFPPRPPRFRATRGRPAHMSRRCTLHQRLVHHPTKVENPHGFQGFNPLVSAIKRPDQLSFSQAPSGRRCTSGHVGESEQACQRDNWASSQSRAPFSSSLLIASLGAHASKPCGAPLTISRVTSTPASVSRRAYSRSSSRKSSMSEV